MVKKKSEPETLNSSEEVLVFPTGDRSRQVLEDLLYEAHTFKLKDFDSIYVTYSKRVKGFDPDDPQWEEVQKALTIRTLKKWYQQQVGVPYRQPTLSDLQKRYRPI